MTLHNNLFFFILYYYMILDYKKQTLFISQIIRIISTIIILYTLNIPIFIKILLIIFTDLFDCGIPRLLFKFDKWIDCSKYIYQKTDKITDSICYILLLFYILKNANMNIYHNYFIILLLIYRLIGVYLFITKHNKKYLFYFPNFFLEISLSLMFINQFSILEKFKIIIIIITIIFKLIQEYYLHIYKS